MVLNQVLDGLDYFSACQNQCVAHNENLFIFPIISIAQLIKLFLNTNLTLAILLDVSKHTFSLLKHLQLKCLCGPSVQNTLF